MTRSLILALASALLAAAPHAQPAPIPFISGHPEQIGRFGFSSASVPDDDGDGVGDFVVGAISEDGGAPPGQ